MNAKCCQKKVSSKFEDFQLKCLFNLRDFSLTHEKAVICHIPSHGSLWCQPLVSACTLTLKNSQMVAWHRYISRGLNVHCVLTTS